MHVVFNMKLVFRCLGYGVICGQDYKVTKVPKY